MGGGGNKGLDRFLFAIAFFLVENMTSNFLTFPKYVLTLLWWSEKKKNYETYNNERKETSFCK